MPLTYWSHAAWDRVAWSCAAWDRVDDALELCCMGPCRRCTGVVPPTHWSRVAWSAAWSRATWSGVADPLELCQHIGAVPLASPSACRICLATSCLVQCMPDMLCRKQPRPMLALPALPRHDSLLCLARLVKFLFLSSKASEAWPHEFRSRGHLRCLDLVGSTWC